MVALVTGGGRGIGQGIALRLAKEGWAVAVTARSEDQLQETVRQSGGRAIAVPDGHGGSGVGKADGGPGGAGSRAGDPAGE